MLIHVLICAREQIIRLQGQVDKQYAGLKDMAEERKRKLENMYHLFQLKREADDLEQWIAEKELVASSPEMGQDFDHVTVSPDLCPWTFMGVGVIGDILAHRHFTHSNTPYPYYRGSLLHKYTHHTNHTTSIPTTHNTTKQHQITHIHGIHFTIKHICSTVKPLYYIMHFTYRIPHTSSICTSPYHIDHKHVLHTSYMAQTAHIHARCKVLHRISSTGV